MMSTGCSIPDQLTVSQTREPAPAQCPSPHLPSPGPARQVVGGWRLVWRFPECLLEDCTLLINTQATLRVFLIGIRGMQRLPSQAACSFPGAFHKCRIFSASPRPQCPGDTSAPSSSPFWLQGRNLLSSEVRREVSSLLTLASCSNSCPVCWQMPSHPRT